MPRLYLYGHELPDTERAKFSYLDDEEFMGNYFFLHDKKYFDFYDTTAIHSYLAYDTWLQVNEQIERYYLGDLQHDYLHSESGRDIRTNLTKA